MKLNESMKMNDSMPIIDVLNAGVKDDFVGSGRRAGGGKGKELNQMDQQQSMSGTIHSGLNSVLLNNRNMQEQMFLSQLQNNRMVRKPGISCINFDRNRGTSLETLAPHSSTTESNNMTMFTSEMMQQQKFGRKRNINQVSASNFGMIKTKRLGMADAS